MTGLEGAVVGGAFVSVVGALWHVLRVRGLRTSYRESLRRRARVTRLEVQALRRQAERLNMRLAAGENSSSESEPGAGRAGGSSGQEEIEEIEERLFRFYLERVEELRVALSGSSSRGVGGSAGGTCGGEARTER